MKTFNQNISLILIAVATLFMTGCAWNKKPEMETVKFVDINRFMGKWFVIGNIPTFIEKHAINSIEHYELNEDGDVNIKFSFVKNKNEPKYKEYSAKGFIADTVTNSKWRVQFFWPVKFDYLVLDVADDYSYTVVGVPSRKYVWIMARDFEMDSKTYDKILQDLSILGYDINKIKKVPQKWNNTNNSQSLRLEKKEMFRKNIAIVGTGISGLTAAWKLHKEYDITVFEANSYIGGHTNTVDVELEGKQYAVDTGFIVYNNRTYPNFSRLLKQLDVETQEAPMSFSVRDEKSGLEYSGSNLNTIFAQRSNLMKPSFYRMLKGIMRFNEDSKMVMHKLSDYATLGDFLEAYNYPEEMTNKYIIPMGAAIWSTSHDQMMDFPAKTFLQFFLNHGLLDVKDRPQWRTVTGGSRSYVEKLTVEFKDRIKLNAPVKSVTRQEDGVKIVYGDKNVAFFDEVILATHSNQSLKILEDASSDEKRILSAIPYQKNIAVLHTDKNLLPRKKLAWAAWNSHVGLAGSEFVALTYNMNILQSIKSDHVFNVTLNCPEAINPEKVLKTISYEHPLFTTEGIKAQRQKYQINGVNKTWFAGAYWGYGFHEDGVNSALDVIKEIRKDHEKVAI